MRTKHLVVLVTLLAAQVGSAFAFEATHSLGDPISLKLSESLVPETKFPLNAQGWKQLLTMPAEERLQLFEETFNLWRALADRNPLDARFQLDFIALAAELPGKESEAITRFVQHALAHSAAPPYVLEAVARAQTRIGNSAAALDLLDASYHADKTRLEPLLAAVDLGIEIGQLDLARAHAELATQIAPGKAIVWEALGSVLRRQGLHAEALGAYEKARGIDATRQAAKEGSYLALRRLSSHADAVRLANAEPPLSARVREEEAHDLAVMRYRWAGTKSGSTPDFETEVKEARRELPEGAESAKPLVLAGDRITMLKDLSRYHEIMADCDEVQQKNDWEKLPDYAKQFCAIAYQEHRRPVEAQKILEELIARNPTVFNYKHSLFFALVDQDKFEDAAKLADHLVDTTPMFLRAWSKNLRRPNPDYVTVRVLQSMVRGYADNPTAGLKMLNDTFERAPGNASVRGARGYLLLWDRRPTEAETQFRFIVGMDQDNIEGWMGLADTAYAKGNLREAQAYLAGARNLMGEVPNRAWVRLGLMVQTTYQPEVDVSFSKQVLGASIGGGETGLRIRADGRLHDHDSGYWRPFVAMSQMDVPLNNQADVSWRLVELGVVHTSQDGTRRIEGFVGTEAGHMGAGLRLREQYSDSLGLSADVLTMSTGLPAKAVEARIQAKQLKLGADYADHAGRGISSAVSLTRFSDGNRRLDAFAQAYRQAWETGVHRLTLKTNAGYQRNSLGGRTAYYNPSSAWALAVGADWEWRTPAIQGKPLWTSVSATTGVLTEDTFGSGGLAEIAVGQRYDFGPLQRVWWGLGLATRPYDGQNEKMGVVRVGINRRFD